jgi:hypothetical protein
MGAFQKAHSAAGPSGRIHLSTTSRHDRVVSNNISLHFVADRRPAAHWFEYDPGWQNRAEIQRAMIGELAALIK